MKQCFMLVGKLTVIIYTYEDSKILMKLKSMSEIHQKWMFFVKFLKQRFMVHSFFKETQWREQVILKCCTSGFSTASQGFMIISYPNKTEPCHTYTTTYGNSWMTHTDSTQDCKTLAHTFGFQDLQTLHHTTSSCEDMWKTVFLYHH